MFRREIRRLFIFCSIKKIYQHQLNVTCNHLNGRIHITEMVDDIQDVSHFLVSLLNVFSSSNITKKINVSENRRDKQEWTLQRNWQHGIHKTQDKQSYKHNTICVGHHCTQTNTNEVNKT